jgi:acetyltransferase-like isoleucine patch superfamily enzyme
MTRLLISAAWGMANAYGRGIALMARAMGFWQASVWAGQIRGPFGEMVRQAFYRRTLRETGDSCTFRFGCNFSCPDIRIGHHVRVGYGTHVGRVDIGDDTLIAAYCSLLSGAHLHDFSRTDIPIRSQPGVVQRVTIGRDCWLGAQVVVMADIGEGSVIGSGAVVTRPIPPWSVAVGNPARVIRSRRPGREGVPAKPERDAMDSGASAGSLSGERAGTAREG